MDHFSGLERRALGVRTGAAPGVDAARERIAQAQDLLASHGHPPGRRGELDGHTRAAIGAFQVSHGLPVTHTIDTETHAALTSPPGTSRRLAPPVTHAPPFQHSTSQEGGRYRPGVRAMGKMWKGTEKRVPVIFAQSALAASTAATLQITPSWAFRGENLVIDPTTGALCTVQIPSVGPNPQVAGGTPGTNIPGTAFPPTQTDCMKFGMDISEQGNQLSLTYTNSQTSLTLNFVAMIFGRAVEQLSDAEAAHAARTGLGGAGNYVPHTALAPAMSYAR